MDCISSIIQQEDPSTDNELFQYIPSNPPLTWRQHANTPQDQIQLKPMQDSSDQTTRKAEERQNRKSCKAFGDKDKNQIESKKRKIMHRDNERQRRQEMASLYASLRSLLPIEYLKGRRSISDHIHESVNYIKHLEENIQELKDKKDELKRLISLNSASISSLESLESCEKYSLTVKTCLVGVEVVIETGLRKWFPLSRVLAILVEEGMNVVSCISTKINQRMLHSIKSEVNAGGSIDMSELEEKLTNSIIRSAD